MFLIGTPVLALCIFGLAWLANNPANPDYAHMLYPILIGMYVSVIPFVYLVAELDDAPGLIIIGMVPTFASMVIAVFAAVLQKLLKDAINIKSENKEVYR